LSEVESHLYCGIYCYLHGHVLLGVFYKWKRDLLDLGGQLNIDTKQKEIDNELLKLFAVVEG
jgi:hypothetical protein